MNPKNIPSADDVMDIIMNSLSATEKQLLARGNDKIERDKAVAYFRILKSISEDVEESDVNIANNIFKPLPHSAFITISGEEFSLNISNVKDSLKNISNIEITPLYDCAALTITINGIITKVF